MPKVDNTPAHLKPFRFHGLLPPGFDDSGENVVTDCPFCGREGKLSIRVDSGVWQCWVCQAKGNEKSLLSRLLEAGRKDDDRAYDLARDRGLLSFETLYNWGLVISPTTADWVIPGYAVDKTTYSSSKLSQLYRYVKTRERTLLMPTPGLPHGLLRPLNGGSEVRGEVYICEGPWDGMALWEVLRSTKVGPEGEFSFTGNEGVSLLSNSSVLVAPTATIFQDAWAHLLKGRRVFLMYDNDKAGREGARRATEALSRAEEPPADVLYLGWPEGTLDRYDVRDHLGRGGGTAIGRIPYLRELTEYLEPVPGEWVQAKGAKAGRVEPETVPCRSWKELRTQWQKAMNWIEGLDRGLVCMLATCLSTGQQGNQLWIKLIGPPSSGKSELCEAVTTSKRYVKAKSTIRGLFSGYQEDKEGTKDASLAPMLRNMTLVTKDGDTLLQMPNRDQILSEFRDAYDRVSRTQYRNKMSRDHEGLNMTWILAGTESLRVLDSSELGERMLDVVICQTLEEDVEDEISLQKAFEERDALNFLYDGKPESRDRPEKVLAKQMTGGYVDYLRENAEEILSGTGFPDGYLYRIRTLGTFVSYMRSRPSKRQDETYQRELSFRLVAQLTRLAKCIAAVTQKPSVDPEVMGVVTRVALDTSRGRTLEMVHKMAENQDRGVLAGVFPIITGLDEAKSGFLLKHLQGIKAVERFRPSENNVSGSWRYRLTDRMARLYREVYDVG